MTGARIIPGLQARFLQGLEVRFKPFSPTAKKKPRNGGIFPWAGGRTADLKSHPEDDSYPDELLDAFQNPGSRRVAVLTCSPCIRPIMSNDPFSF